ncbi:Glutamate-1-semialdehyde aminotransferase [Desulfurella amilsii]|uniref:Glutamate-1-semialdehyde 2,1-aminomutase n=1 Tax=Desulfurella amilsii TaxID=1562698 RepID=A0A1X4XZH7_9BACT|nr:glutamate-1-semialdehyde 2,1-aminomutase [Desulfurella amilsii]OSS42947.1 Glutamate-1-semialdehyde aminotransferase [Desulfurella amilsii]
MFDESKKLFEEAKKYIVGGVNSPVRAFKSVGIDPIFIKNAKGAYLYSEDDRQFIDYVSSFGPNILGHANNTIVNKVKAALENGFTYGACTKAEVDLAKRIVETFDSVELTRFVNSGTEAVMSAIRLARGFTQRENCLKFKGCYHGHYDGMLVGAGSGAATFGVPTSKGVIEDIAKHTLICEYNDFDAVKKIFQDYGHTIACVIVEPIAANMGVVLPKPGFLQFLRDITYQYNSLLIFDEVITGFRACYGGIQTLENIKPDLTILGKIIGGGFPLAMYGGNRDIMSLVSPEGPVYQAGTLSGNPIAVQAGIATLDMLKNTNPYNQLKLNTQILVSRTMGLANTYDIPLSENSFGSCFTFFFTENKPTNYPEVLKSNERLFKNFFLGMIKRGIYFAPSQFEANFLSTAHTKKDIEITINAAEEIFKELKDAKFIV